MINKFYFSAWILLILAAFASIFTGTLNAATTVALSLFALVLVFALALWSVIVNTRRSAK